MKEVTYADAAKKTTTETKKELGFKWSQSGSEFILFSDSPEQRFEFDVEKLSSAELKNLMYALRTMTQECVKQY